MKLLLITLLSALASVTGELMTLDGSVLAPMEPMEEAPEMVVFYVNEQAAATACTERELLYIDSKMLPDIDMTLLENNFETPDWQFSADASRRNLAGGTCNWCRTVFPNHLCNAMYNCGFRRNLRQSQDATRKLNAVELSSSILQDCRDNISALSTNKFLSQSCKTAVTAATCHVEFV